MSYPFMPFFVSDYLGDTMHLTTQQHGAYLLILMAMWTSGGSLPDNESKLARIARVPLKTWRRIGPDVMAFFRRGDGSITNDRLQKEFARCELRSAAQSRNVRAKYLKNKEVVATTVEPSNNRCSTPIPIPIPRSKKVSKNNTPPASPAATPRGELLATLDALHADAVIEHRQRLRKPLTCRAARMLANQFRLTPDPNAAADTMIARGWIGFEAEWLANAERGMRGGGKPDGESQFREVIRRQLEKCNPQPEDEYGNRTATIIDITPCREGAAGDYPHRVYAQGDEGAGD